MKFKLLIAATALALTSLAMAQPSQYFIFKNNKTGQTTCQPQIDGADAVNWTQQDGGPYSDPDCKVPG
jgi:hypothetical protein